MTEFVVRTFHQPEYYIHVLLNPLPIYGLAVGLIALLAGIVSRSRAANICALIVVMITAASAWPVSEFGEAGYDIMYSRSDQTGDAWLSEHCGFGCDSHFGTAQMAKVLGGPGPFCSGIGLPGLRDGRLHCLSGRENSSFRVSNGIPAET